MMGTACSLEKSQGMVFDKSKIKDSREKLLRSRCRNQMSNTSSSNEVNFRVSKQEEWTPTQALAPIKDSPTANKPNVETLSTREVSEVSLEDGTNNPITSSAPDTAANSVATNTLLASSNNISTMTSATDHTPAAQKKEDPWQIPPRLASLSSDVQDLILGHQVELAKLMRQPHVIDLKVVAPGEECMKERLALWENALMPLKLTCADLGYVLNIEDDLWSSTNLDKAYGNLVTQQCDATGRLEAWSLDEGLDDLMSTDVVVMILSDTFQPRLPPVLTHDDYTLTLVSLPDSATTALFHDLYTNNENRRPPAYELKYHVMVRQEEAKLLRLIEFMMDMYRREDKELHIFHSDYYQLVSASLHDKGLLSTGTVAVFKSNRTRSSKDDETDSRSRSVCSNERPDVIQDIKNQCPLENQIQLVLLPVEEKDDLMKVEGDVNSSRLQKMSLEVKDRVEKIILKVIGQRDSEKRLEATGVPRSLLEELVHQSRHYQQLTSVEPLLESPTLASLQDYVSNVSEMPIVVYAEPGWGLSTMGAELVKSCVHSLPTSIIIYRFLGISPDSRTLLSTLLSVQQQLDVIFGPKISSDKVKQTSSLEGLLKDIVTRSTAQLPMLIILEGLALVSGQLKELEVMSLTEHLPTTTKLLVMTSDPDIARGLRTKMKDAFYVKAVSWDKDVVMGLFTDSMTRSGRKLTESQNSALRSAIQSCPLPLYSAIVAKLAVTWRAVTEIVEDDLPGSVEGVLNKMLDYLEKTVPSDCFTAMMAYLTGSLGGITKWEITDLLSINDSVLLSIYSDDRDPPIHRAPPILWRFISAYLKPFLNVFVSYYFYSYSWTSSTIRKCVSSRYISSSATSGILHREMSEYFQGCWSGKKKPFPDPDGKAELLQDRFIMPQPEKFGKHFNVHKFMCLPYHLMKSKNKNSYALENCIFNLPWVQNKIDCSSVVQVVCDLELAKTMETSSTGDIELIQGVVLSSAGSLNFNGREVYKYLRRHMEFVSNTDQEVASKTLNIKNNGLAKFYTWLSNPPWSFIHPLDNVPADNYHSSFLPVPSIDAIVPLGSDEFNVHIAVVLKSEGEIKIINIVKNVCVRTLTGVYRPQTLIMLEFPKALVLCNRELCIIDLEEGKLISKLRGVLNLRLPLFGLQNKQRAVVLSRDRMVVNILDIESGTTVASFKAGETRFLDSLIISGDGSVLVCGDETQKPFPLLVWSLVQSKLVHDIRVPQHEFITGLADISYNGRYLACGCREVNDDASNFVALFDLFSGQLIKKFKMPGMCTAVALSSKAMSVAVALDTYQLSIWDVVSGNHKCLIDGARVAMDTILLTPAGTVALTYCKQESSISSHTLCLWDLDHGEFLASHTFESPITCAHLTPDGKMVLAGIRGHNCPIRLLLVPVGCTLAAVRETWEQEKGGEKATFGDILRQGCMVNLAMGND